MKESTLGKSLTNVNSVASVLVMPEHLVCTVEPTLEKSLISVSNVGSVLLRPVI